MSESSQGAVCQQSTLFAYNEVVCSLGFRSGVSFVVCVRRKFRTKFVVFDTMLYTLEVS